MKFNLKSKNQKGFTLIELLVVVSMMALLISIASATFTSAKNNAKISTAQSEIKQLQIAFEMFFNDQSDYPPTESHVCSGCTNPPNSSWVDVAEALTPYTSGKVLDKDPWGNYFAYDKNYKQPCWNAWSVLCSAGPNGIMETNICQQDSIIGGDDICVFFPDTD